MFKSALLTPNIIYVNINLPDLISLFIKADKKSLAGAPGFSKTYTAAGYAGRSEGGAQPAGGRGYPSEFKAARMLQMLQFAGLEFQIDKAAADEARAVQFMSADNGNGMREKFSFFGKKPVKTNPYIAPHSDFSLSGYAIKTPEIFSRPSLM